jgi:hypothetical protein
VWHEILGAFNQDISYSRNETIAVFLEETITLPLPCQTLDDLEEIVDIK